MCVCAYVVPEKWFQNLVVEWMMEGLGAELGLSEHHPPFLLKLKPTFGSHLLSTLLCSGLCFFILEFIVM